VSDIDSLTTTEFEPGGKVMQLQVFKRINSRSIFRLLNLLLCFTAIPIFGNDLSFAAQAGKNSSGACQLNSASGNIQRVIYIVFDNTHFRRDNPNVLSDLEQMPALLNFIKGNGTLLSNHHTILIAHTAGGILSSLTGLYPRSERHHRVEQL
jgi:hypothetical protein